MVASHKLRGGQRFAKEGDASPVKQAVLVAAPINGTGVCKGEQAQSNDRGQNQAEGNEFHDPQSAVLMALVN